MIRFQCWSDTVWLERNDVIFLFCMQYVTNYLSLPPQNKCKIRRREKSQQAGLLQKRDTIHYDIMMLLCVNKFKPMAAA